MGTKFIYFYSIKICASGFEELLKSIFCLLLVVEAFSLQKVIEMLASGSWLVRGQVNMVDEVKFVAQSVPLWACWLCRV